MGLLDVVNRGVVGGLLGAPVDLSTGAVNAGLMGAGVLGHQLGLLSAEQMPQPITEPVGGSEWIGSRMQDAGLVSAERSPLAEFLASMAGPAAGAKAASGLGMLGAMSPQGKARLLADLQARLSSGRYRLGDVTEGQGKGLDALFGRASSSRDVHMTDKALDHLVDGRIDLDGLTPEQVVQAAEAAMAKRARPDLNVSKANQNPSLLNTGVVDQATGQRYNPRMPLKQAEDGYEVRTVSPEGLRSRNNKAPKR